MARHAKNESKKTGKHGKTAVDPIQQVVWATDEEFQDLKDFAESLVVDGELSEDDVVLISAAIDEQESRGRLTEEQRAQIQKTISEGVEKYGSTKVPRLLAVFGVLSLVFGGLTALAMAFSAVLVLRSGASLLLNYQGSNVELIFVIAQSVVFTVGAVLHVILGVRLLKKKRYGAAQIANILVVLGVVDMFLETMLTGIGANLIFVVAVTAFRAILSAYLSPSLAQERKLADNMRMTDVKVRAETHTLGLDLSGKNYIKLDFFNVFWVFVITCVLGVVVEVLFHMIVVDPGVYQDRRGLLFGPFSPIYGVGAVLMTVALNRFKNAGLLVTFAVCTLIGGTFEYCVSLYMEVAYGVIAWDYSDQFLNVNGRTCLLYASMFGLMGLWWIKWALPRLLSIINMIPWKIRYSVTTVCAVLMLFNIGMTFQALDCWQERVNGEPVVSEVQQFYATYFDNDEMANRFQSMTITPQVKE